ncbi:protein [Escherichia coli]|uniref:hypothetical protein n=1 Tax=Escherichia coli TaxID=562 RepID=UPI00191B19BE|nr:hypothetical protein [Escherichia coli]CAD6075360.1 protein [Escherichia coli]
MKGYSVSHFLPPSIPPMYETVNTYNRNIDYWKVKIKFAEIISTNDVNEIYSISDELRRILSAITALNVYKGDVSSVMIRIQPENRSPFIIDISTGVNDDYIIQTLDVGTFSPFGEKCTCSAINRKDLECIKETIFKFCAKFTQKEVILTEFNHFNKTDNVSDCWQILFFSPDHFNHDSH